MYPSRLLLHYLEPLLNLFEAFLNNLEVLLVCMETVLNYLEARLDIFGLIFFEHHRIDYYWEIIITIFNWLYVLVIFVFE